MGRREERERQQQNRALREGRRPRESGVFFGLAIPAWANQPTELRRDTPSSTSSTMTIALTGTQVSDRAPTSRTRMWQREESERRARARVADAHRHRTRDARRSPAPASGHSRDLQAQCVRALDLSCAIAPPRCPPHPVLGFSPTTRRGDVFPPSRRCVAPHPNRSPATGRPARSRGRDPSSSRSGCLRAGSRRPASL